METGRNQLIGEFRPIQALENSMKDIPLRKAIVATKGVAPKVYPASRRTVMVFEWPTVTEDRDYEITYGAGNVEFQEATPRKRLRLLLGHKRELIEEYEVPDQIVDDALVVIPEYRRAKQRAERG